MKLVPKRQSVSFQLVLIRDQMKAENIQLQDINKFHCCQLLTNSVECIYDNLIIQDLNVRLTYEQQKCSHQLKRIYTKQNIFPLPLIK